MRLRTTLAAALLRDPDLLVVDDPAEAAARFAYSVIGPAQDRALLTGVLPPPSEIRRTAAAAARAFFAAHRRG